MRRRAIYVKNLVTYIVTEMLKKNTADKELITNTKNVQENSEPKSLCLSVFMKNYQKINVNAQLQVELLLKFRGI